LAVIGARVAYRLPYFWAKMRVAGDGQAIRYSSSRRWPHSARQFTNIAVRPGGRVELTERDHFLTARYRLYSVVRGRLGYAQIEHEPWPLVGGTVSQMDQNLIQAAGLPPPEGAPLVHYSAELNVRIGHLRLC